MAPSEIRGTKRCHTMLRFSLDVAESSTGPPPHDIMESFGTTLLVHLNLQAVKLYKTLPSTTQCCTNCAGSPFTVLQINVGTKNSLYCQLYTTFT